MICVQEEATFYSARIVGYLKITVRALPRISNYLTRHERDADWPRFCPICARYSTKFLEFGIVKKRAGAKCPVCGSLERHRLLWLYFERMTSLLDEKPKKMLHIGPELPIEQRLRRHLGPGYVTADLHDPRADVRMDITSCPYSESSFDVVCCCHVLEHIQQDVLAIQEISRILKPSGWAAIIVPITAPKTVEDPTIVESADRLRYFGHEDHVRRYGPDFADKLELARFTVKVISSSDFLSVDEIALMGVDPVGTIYHCSKE